jgi:hypothetical protein
MPLDLVNAKPRYRPATLIEPPPTGYILLSAEVEPPGRAPFPSRSANRTALLGRLRGMTGRLEQVDAVTKATAYRTVVAPPVAGYAKTATHPARYDVIVLVETTSPAVIGEVEATEAGKELMEELEGSARRVDVMRARCVKRIGDVDKTRPGLFLFNYFVAEDPAVALDLWDHLAGWYMSETGLDNSTLLQPVDSATYAFVNHARWDQGVPRLFLQQMAKPSFYRFVRPNLDRHKTGAMPVLCRLA